MIRHGRIEPGDDPCLSWAWAPGNRYAAHTLALLLINNRAMLEAAGVDFTMLEIKGVAMPPTDEATP